VDAAIADSDAQEKISDLEQRIRELKQQLEDALEGVAPSSSATAEVELGKQ